MTRTAIRRRRFLFGFLAGLIVSGFVAPPMMPMPVIGDLIWSLWFAIPAGLCAAILPVNDSGPA